MRCAQRLLPALAALLALGCSAAFPAPSDVPVRVGYVALDTETDSPVLVLEEIGGTRLLPIWIGVAEARSISAQLNRIRSPRPGTHDLAKRVIDGLAGEVERVVVTDLSDGVYYALLFLRTPRGVVEIDARPSDAIAIALRFEAPVFVREAVFGASGDPRQPPESGQGI
jgi:bifunctional DNase/RNase